MTSDIHTDGLKRSDKRKNVRESRMNKRVSEYSSRAAVAAAKHDGTSSAEQSTARLALADAFANDYLSMHQHFGAFACRRRWAEGREGREGS